MSFTTCFLTMNTGRYPGWTRGRRKKTPIRNATAREIPQEVIMPEEKPENVTTNFEPKRKAEPVAVEETVVVEEEEEWVK